ncbi:MAG: sodium:solute symporter family protein [Ignavibacteria bacterium]|nr:sodium:solute symporter family protein [Ignavibacteria bacterium]
MVSFDLNFTDYFVISLYYLFTFAIAFIFPKLKGRIDEIDYISAGRKVTLPFFVASLVATWYGNILGVGEFVYRYGILAWFCFGIVYYISAFAYSLLLTKLIRNAPANTIPEQIGLKFGETARIVSTIILSTITFPAVYVLMVGVIFQMILQIPFFFAIVLGTILTFIYISAGGFKSNLLSNSLQFVLMYAGFIVLSIFALQSINFDFIKFSNLPQSHLSLLGNASWQFIVSWIIISFQTFIDPSFFQRCISAKSIKVARKGILISILFWLLFDTMTVTTGLIAKIHFPDINPLLTYPILSNEFLPHFWKGFFIVAMLATIVSTLESYTFLSALMIGNDLFSKVRLLENKSLKARIRIGLVVTAIFSIFLSVAIPSAIDLIYRTSAIAFPALFYPLMISFTKKKLISNRQSIWLMSISALATIFFIVVKYYVVLDNSFVKNLTSLEPMFFGFICSTLLFLIFVSIKKPRATTTTRV